jgi:hypothetical protein
VDENSAVVKTMKPPAQAPHEHDQQGSDHREGERVALDHAGEDRLQRAGEDGHHARHVDAKSRVGTALGDPVEPLLQRSDVGRVLDRIGEGHDEPQTRQPKVPIREVVQIVRAAALEEEELLGNRAANASVAIRVRRPRPTGAWTNCESPITLSKHYVIENL